MSVLFDLMRFSNILGLILQTIGIIYLAQALGDLGGLYVIQGFIMSWSVLFQIWPEIRKSMIFRFPAQAVSLLTMAFFAYTVYMGLTDTSMFGPAIWAIVILFISGPTVITGTTLLVLVNLDLEHKRKLVIGQNQTGPKIMYVQGNPERPVTETYVMI